MLLEELGLAHPCGPKGMPRSLPALGSQVGTGVRQDSTVYMCTLGLDKVNRLSPGKPTAVAGTTEGIQRQHSAPLLTIRTFLINTSSSVVPLFSCIGNLAYTGSHIIEGSHAPGRTHCALTCLSSPFLQRTRTTGAPGKKVMTDRHSSSWRICWVYVKAQIWRGRVREGHMGILGGHHCWDTTGLTCDNVTRFGTKY